MKEIKLTQGRIALVDDEDYDRVNQFKWHFNRGYAYRPHKLQDGSRQAMHRFIMDTPAGMDTDHIDRNGLNNQKDNLRVCTRSQNQMNTKRRNQGLSKFKGVCVLWRKGYVRYHSQIVVDGKDIRRYFPFTPEGEIQAAKSYNEMAKKYFGEFANLNDV